MKRTLTVLGTVVALLFGGAMIAPAASADDDDVRVCRGTIGKVKIDADIRVPNGATCNLRGTRVDGDIKVGKNAKLSAKSVKVDGDIKGTKHRHVGVVDSKIDGDIVAKQGKSVNLRKNKIDGDVKVLNNRGKITIVSNRIDDELTCKGNKPAPKGRANKAGDGKKGQCKKL